MLPGSTGRALYVGVQAELSIKRGKKRRARDIYRICYGDLIMMQRGEGGEGGEGAEGSEGGGGGEGRITSSHASESAIQMVRYVSRRVHAASRLPIPFCTAI